MDLWLELARIAANLATPIVVAAVGVLLLGRIESIKTEFAKESDFQRKWAEQFFDCCQSFMKNIERGLAVIQQIAECTSENSDSPAALRQEIWSLTPNIVEQELRIRRSVVFAPSAGEDAAAAAHDCVVLIGRLFASRPGNLDEIVGEMNRFNTAARAAHAEMLGLRR